MSTLQVVAPEHELHKSTMVTFPPEILCQIFLVLSLHKESPYRYSDPRTWIAITHVCRYWRNIALEYSGLWARVSFLQVDWMNVMLERSRDAALYIKEDHLSWPFRDLFYNTVKSNIHRVVQFHLTGYPGFFKDLPETLRVPAPLLEVLTLVSDNTSIPSVRLPGFINFPFASQVPRLRELRISNLLIVWDWPAMGELTSLCLENTFQFDQKIDNFFRVLQQMPRLEKLSLTGSSMPAPAEKSNPRQPITLPRLSKIFLTGPPSRCLFVSANISSPALETLIISCESSFLYPRVLSIPGEYHHHLKELIASCTRTLPSVPLALNVVHELSAEDYNYVQFEMRPSNSRDGRSFNISIPALPRVSFDEQFLELCRTSRNVHVTDLLVDCEGGTGEISEDVWVAGLSHLDAISCLTMKMQLVEPLLLALTKDREVEGENTTGILLPQLENLVIMSTCWLDLTDESLPLQRFLEARRDIGSAIQNLKIEICGCADEEELGSLKLIATVEICRFICHKHD